MTETDLQAACAAITRCAPTAAEAAQNLQAGMMAVLMSPEMAGFRAALERMRDNPGQSPADVAEIRREFLALGGGA